MNPLHPRARCLGASAGLLLVLTVGCATPPPPAEPPPGPPTAAAPALPVAAAPVADSETGPQREEPPSLPPLVGAQAVQRALVAAIEQMENGQEVPAQLELERILQAEPQHRLAQSLLRQIKEDPSTLFGRESFSYRVQPGESLSAIAQRFLRDAYLFYGLARYNGIKVPRQLAAGQFIKVPGKAPPAGGAEAAPAISPAAPAARSPVVTDPGAAATSSSASSPAAAAQAATLIARYSREARSALAKQDLVAAIRAWDRVLQIDPNHRTAQLERSKAYDLCKRLNELSKGPPKDC